MCPLLPFSCSCTENLTKWLPYTDPFRCHFQKRASSSICLGVTELVEEEEEEEGAEAPDDVEGRMTVGRADERTRRGTQSAARDCRQRSCWMAVRGCAPYRTRIPPLRAHSVQYTPPAQSRKRKADARGDQKATRERAMCPAAVPPTIKNTQCVTFHSSAMSHFPSSSRTRKTRMLVAVPARIWTTLPITVSPLVGKEGHLGPALRRSASTVIHVETVNRRGMERTKRAPGFSLMSSRFGSIGKRTVAQELMWKDGRVGGGKCVDLLCV